MTSTGNLTAFGPDDTCTLALCPATDSVYEYRPSLAANAVFLAIFALSMIVAIWQRIRWRTTSFTIAIVLGYLCEIIGYGGRIMLWQNPFSFNGFLLQIICLTIGPAFFSAGIYLTLANIVRYLGVSYSRFSPSFYYWIFIPCDVVSLTLQAAGGGLSTNSNGSSKVGVDIALAGLCFQVFTLTVFCVLAVDYALRYRTAVSHAESDQGNSLPISFKTFVAFLVLAIVSILVRCVYRIDELSDGYGGPLIHNQNLFIGLESIMIVIAAFALNGCYPGIGLVYQRSLGNRMEDSGDAVTKIESEGGESS